MIDFEKIHQDVLSKITANLPPEEQRTGAHQLAATVSSIAAQTGYLTIVEYHKALQTLPPDEH